MCSPVIETHDLSKKYGRVNAVSGLNLSVPAAGITAFLGRNGAGKSTTIKMLLGMVRPNSGYGTIQGLRIEDPKDSVRIRQRVAYVAEDKNLYPYMTIGQLIRFVRSFYLDWSVEAEQHYLREYNLPSGQRISSLSKGMRTKLALLLALARRPMLLILDEPSEGLDPVGIEHLLQSLVTLASEGTAVFFSSHQIPEVERIADSVRIIDNGELVLSASMDSLRGSYRQVTMLFQKPPESGQFEMDGIERAHIEGASITFLTCKDTGPMVERAKTLGVTDVKITAISLRELFLGTVNKG